MIVFEDTKYIRATHATHNDCDFIEFRNFLNRNNIRYFISAIDNSAFMKNDNTKMFDMILLPSEIDEISAFLKKHEERTISSHCFIGPRSGIVIWDGCYECLFTSPLGTEIWIRNVEAEKAYINFDEDQYALNLYGDKDYPLDLIALVEDGKVIKAAYLDICLYFKQ